MSGFLTTRPHVPGRPRHPARKVRQQTQNTLRGFQKAGERQRDELYTASLSLPVKAVLLTRARHGLQQLPVSGEKTNERISKKKRVSLALKCDPSVQGVGCARLPALGHVGCSALTALLPDSWVLPEA